MDGIILRVKENGQIEEYKEPYTTIECETEEDFKRLERLLNLGKAVEKALKHGFFIYDTVTNFDGNVTDFNHDDTVEELLQWLEESEGK